MIGFEYKVPKEYPEQTVKYCAGQPMGAYSS